MVYGEPNFKMWDKCQMIVILIRTNYAKDKIFVGDENDTLKALKELLTWKKQRTDYMEKVLIMVTINSTTEDQNQNYSMNQTHTPLYNL